MKGTKGKAAATGSKRPTPNQGTTASSSGQRTTGTASNTLH